MTEQEKQALIGSIGKQASDAVIAELANYETRVKTMVTEAAKNGGYVTEAAMTAVKEASESALKTVEAALEKQGTTIAELQTKLTTGSSVGKSVREVLEESAEKLQNRYNSKQGTEAFMLTMNHKGEFVMTPFNDSTIKTPQANATIGGLLAGPAGVASISQSLDAATLLRIGAGSPIMGQYRNTPWVFDLCNTINASFVSGMPYAIWYDELAKDGASTNVAEGGTKPLSQYKYQLNSSTYKKEAVLIGFTEEFKMDFAQLESDILNKGRLDLINRVNAAILPNIISAATEYNTADSFKAGVAVSNANDFDAIAACAAQVDSATFGGSIANAAVMSTFKKYRMGISKDLDSSYLNAPQVLNNISLVGNPGMGADDLLVGDFKQYNIMLRGGLIVRVGYNGTDFAENKYSVVMEQFYYDYISNVRKAAIVKGADFATVKGLIGA